MIGQEFILSVLESDALPEVVQALSDSNFAPDSYPCVYCEAANFDFGQLSDDGAVSSTTEPYTMAVIMEAKNLNDNTYKDPGSRALRAELFELAKKVVKKIIIASGKAHGISYVEFGKAEILDSKVGSKPVMIIQFPAEVTVAEF